MAKRKQRATRLASVAVLSGTVLANPPPVKDEEPPDVMVNLPSPGAERQPVADAGTAPTPGKAIRPVIVNQVSPVDRLPAPRPESAPDGGTPKKKSPGR